jgi:hypothetical protein
VKVGYPPPLPSPKKLNPPMMNAVCLENILLFNDSCKRYYFIRILFAHNNVLVQYERTHQVDIIWALNKVEIYCGDLDRTEGFGG